MDLRFHWNPDRFGDSNSKLFYPKHSDWTYEKRSHVIKPYANHPLKGFPTFFLNDGIISDDKKIW